MIDKYQENQANQVHQNLTQFNDRLIEKLCHFFQRDFVKASPTPKNQLPNPENVTSNKIQLLKTKEVLENLNCLQSPLHKIPLLSKAPLPPFPISYEELEIRKWEDDIYDKNVLNSSSQFETHLGNRNTDFLSEEFSGKFESDSEFQASKPLKFELSPNQSPVTFLSNQLSTKTVFGGIALFEFPMLIDKLEERSLCFRRYECDQCGRKFYNPAALGGHKSKQHPKTSKRYIERKNTYSLRIGERKKRSFLNNL